MLKWRCIQAERERHLYMFMHGCTCLKSMTITHKYTTNDTDVDLEEDTRKHKDAASIQIAPTLSSEATKGLDAKCLSFHNNCPYRERRHVASRESLFICVWEEGGVIQHLSSLRRPRLHINADLTICDRTSSFSTIIPSSQHHTLSFWCPWLKSWDPLLFSGRGSMVAQ